MKKYLESFMLILQFMTRLPINKNLSCENDDFKRGTMFLPLVGMIIGGIQWLVFQLLIYKLPITIVAVLVIITGVLVTGALHIDGLGDTCDGFFAFKGRDKIIEIMKDSRIGTYAVIAIILDILLKFSCIVSINSIKASLIIIIAPAIGRTALVLLFNIGKPAKKQGTGNLFIQNSGIKELIIGGSCTVVAAFLSMGLLKTVILIVAAVLVIIIFYRFCEKKIGGITGDNLGAANELVELLTFVLFIAMQ